MIGSYLMCLDFSDITPAESRRLSELLQALRTKIVSRIFTKSAIFSDLFMDEFQSRLLAQHVFMGNVLFQESFDAAFIESAKVSGHYVENAPKGQRFWDVAIDGKRISLKSTKAKALRDETLHISKLTEAAWIQDCRSAKARREKTISLFSDYISMVDTIYQLRYFSNTHRYELVEIPVVLFSEIMGLPEKVFCADGPSINIPIGAVPPYFTLKLDRSDAKITLANILKANCIVHAIWEF